MILTNSDKKYIDHFYNGIFLLTILILTNSDNYFYDEEDLLTFWGVKNLKDINGSVYIREFENLTREDEKYWRSLSLNGYQIKVYWC